MQLKFEKSIKNRVITIDLETANFTRRENQALDRFGEPVIKFEKMYNGLHPVQFEKRIRSGFKLKLRFDGEKDIASAALAANQFFEDIQLVLEETLRGLIDNLDLFEVDFTTESGFLDIKY